jgi:serine/threonine protein kinase
MNIPLWNQKLPESTGGGDWMEQAVLDDFLSGFDDSRFPESFLRTYEPMECLSAGQSCETLLVMNRQTGMYFVAKCYTDPLLLSRTTESDLLRNLHHAGLPSFIDEHRNDKMLCVVREYAQGTPLDKLVMEKQLSEKEIIALAVRLCDILTYLHGQTPPVIHRDIKPQNIIVGGDGSIKLIDFGISRLYNESAKSDTVFFGTQEFAPPEQYGFSQTDSRSDIFSLGVLLCWLLTGEADAGKAAGRIRNRRLAHIVRKCAAFAPKDRYPNASRVKDALTGSAAHRKLTAAFCSAAAVFTALFLLLGPAASRLLHNMLEEYAGVEFREPLIEQAVRQALSKGADEKITTEDLLSVGELYVFGDKIAADMESYQELCSEFVSNTGTVHRGSITSLDDIAKMKNIRKLLLAYQDISDVTPLAQCPSLAFIELKHNPIKDVSPLKDLAFLDTLLIFDTKVSDLTYLSTCPLLCAIDVGYTQIKSIAALDGISSLKMLSIRKAPIETLDHIESHPKLESLYIAETNVTDLTPLLALPLLKAVEISRDMSEAENSVAGKASFEIIYQ